MKYVKRIKYFKYGTGGTWNALPAEGGWIRRLPMRLIHLLYTAKQRLVCAVRQARGLSFRQGCE